MLYQHTRRWEFLGFEGVFLYDASTSGVGWPAAVVGTWRCGFLLIMLCFVCLSLLVFIWTVIDGLYMDGHTLGRQPYNTDASTISESPSRHR